MDPQTMELLECGGMHQRQGCRERSGLGQYSLEEILNPYASLFCLEPKSGLLSLCISNMMS